MGQDVRIRQADSQDIDTVLPLFGAYRVFYGLAPQARASWVYLAARLADGSSCLLLAEDDDGAGLGFAWLYPGFDSLALAPSWQLHDLFVAPEARGHGIARALLDAAEAAAREAGAACIVLQTAHDNLAAQALYQSAGYVRDTVFENYTLTLDA